VGYVAYHVRDQRTGHRTRNQELTVKDLVWLNADAYRALWSWGARPHIGGPQRWQRAPAHDTDLVGRILWQRAPADDPGRELFVEPRLLHPEWRDGIWLRMIDAPRALEMRGYDAEASITLELAPDALTPWNGGRFKLECSREGARVSPTRDAPDLQLTVKALSSLYTGYRTPRQLAAWGLAKGDDETLALAARIFATRHAPHCPDNF
jgi:predicted acetyltransferase